MVTDDELINILGKEIVMNYRIIQNESGNPSLHKYVGTTKSGNRIFLNREILGYDHIVLTGFMVRVDKPYDIVITSNSGYPLDLNIYQTVKGMSAAAQVVKDGGTIIIAAECWDGIPSNSDYETILTSVDSANSLMDYIKKMRKVSRIHGRYISRY